MLEVLIAIVAIAMGAAAGFYWARTAAAKPGSPEESPKLDRERLLAALNLAEELNGGVPKWGGGATIIGSPQGSGSNLVFSEILRLSQTPSQTPSGTSGSSNRLMRKVAPVIIA